MPTVPKSQKPGITMNTPAKVWLVAIGFVAISIINICGLLLIGGAERIVGRAVRFTLTCILACFLIRGAAWARYVAFVVALFGSLTSVIGAAVLLPQSGRLPPWFLVWGFVMGAVYAVLGVLLAFSNEIRVYFKHGGEARDSES